MTPVNRRKFIESTAGAAVCLGATAASAGANESVPRPPQVELGSTGIKMSRLGQGTGVHGGNRQSDQSRLGFEKLVGLFRHAFDRGITFFDMADLYGTHIYFREALKAIPREQITILTKLWWRYDGPQNNTRAVSRRQATKSALERFRHELTTDYLDIVLLHCLQKDTWPADMQPYLETLTQEKEAQRVRAVGVSCHNLGALRVAAVTPWVDVILARVNPQGVKMDGSPEDVLPVLRRAKANGKAIIGMKILGEGQLADQKEACVKFAQELGLLDALTIGFHTPEQIDDMLRMIHKYPAAATS